MLESVRRLALTGVKMRLPGRDGVWRPMTAIFSILHAAYDDPESKKVTAVKAGQVHGDADVLHPVRRRHRPRSLIWPSIVGELGRILIFGQI